MAKLSSEWVQERTFGGHGRLFWWRLSDDGGLGILRVLGKEDDQRQVVQRFSREELEKLVAFMSDRNRHPLASSVRDMKSSSKRDGVGAFLFRRVGRKTTGPSSTARARSPAPPAGAPR